MATLPIQYRLEVRVSRNVDATETTILTPAAGAPHSDSFKVATMSGLAGYQPYMGWPSGRKGRLNDLTGETDEGTLTVPLIDPKVSATGSDLARWLTAFFGDATGRLQPLQNLAVLQESTDNGATWANYFTGRIGGLRKLSDTEFELVLRDTSSDLETEIGTDRPSALATEIVESLVLPLGISATLGTVTAPKDLVGTTGSQNGTRYIDLNSQSRGRADNLVTAALSRAARFAVGKVPVSLQYPIQPYLRVRFTSGAVVAKELQVVGMEAANAGARKLRVTRLYVRELDNPSDPRYTAFDTGTVANGASISFTVRQRKPARSDGDRAPILSTDLHPVKLLRYLLDGYLSALKDDGSVERTFKRNAAAFTALEADTSFPPARLYLDAPVKMREFISREICRPFELGWRINGSGELVPIDLRLPTSLAGVATITNADLVAEAHATWEADDAGIVTAVEPTIYLDAPFQPADVDAQPNQVPDVPTSLLESVAIAGLPVVDGAGRLKYGEQTEVLESRLLRAQPGETYQGTERALYLLNALRKRGVGWFRAFAAGPQTITLRCLRTSNTNTCEIGDLRILDIDELPDPQSNLRGGAMVVRCLESSVEGLERVLRFRYLGPNLIATAPTIATPAQEAGNPAGGFTDAVTLNAASDPVEFWYAATATSVGVRPADTDPAWQVAQPVGQPYLYITATGTKTFRNLPAGKRLWVRARSVPTGQSAKLPSGWAYPAGTGYVDLQVIAPPTSLILSSVSTLSAQLNFTIGDLTRPHLIRLGKGTSQAAADADPGTDLITLPAGTNRHTLTGLDTYGAGVVWFHPKVVAIDGVGGESTALELSPNVSFQATGAAGTAPALGGLRVLRGGAAGAPPPPGSPPMIIGGPGVELGIYLGPNAVGYGVEIGRGTAPGGPYTTLDMIAATQVSGQLVVYQDPAPIDGTTYYYVARAWGAGVNAGAWSAEVAATSVWLTPSSFGGVGSEPVLGQTETLRIPGSMFAADGSGAIAAVNGAYLSPSLVNVGLTAYAGVVLPDGVTITGFRARVYRNDAGDGVDVILRSATDAVNTTIATLSSASTGWHTLASGALSHVPAAGAALYVYAFLNANVGSAAATEARLAWVEIDFVRNSLRQ